MTTHYQICGGERPPAPRRETSGARCGDLVDVLAEDDINALCTAAALDILAELIGIDRAQEHAAAMHDGHLFVLETNVTRRS